MPVEGVVAASADGIGGACSELDEALELTLPLSGFSNTPLTRSQPNDADNPIKERIAATGRGNPSVLIGR